MIRFSCPGCGAVYSVADDKAGKTGKCPKCQTPFTIPAGEAPAPAPVPVSPPPPPPVPSNPFADLGADDAPRKKKSPSKADLDDDAPPPKKKPARRDDEDDDYDDRPRKKGRRDDDDYDDDPPPKKKPARRDEDDDYDDAPPKKKSAPAPAAGGDDFADFDTAAPSKKKAVKGRRDDDDYDDDYDDRPKKKAAKGRRDDDDYDDDYDDRPKKKAKGRAADDDYDDDYDDRPRKKGRRDDDDDYDDDYDRPRKKSKGGSGLLVAAGVVHCVFALVYVCSGGWDLFFGRAVAIGSEGGSKVVDFSKDPAFTKGMSPKEKADFEKNLGNAKALTSEGSVYGSVMTILGVAALLAGCLMIPAGIGCFMKKKWCLYLTLAAAGLMILIFLVRLITSFLYVSLFLTFGGVILSVALPAIYAAFVLFAVLNKQSRRVLT